MAPTKFMRRALHTALTFAAMMASGTTQGSGTKLLVPAYANPCCANGPALWTAVNAFAAAYPSQLGVIFNPASGPGTSPVDPNYVDNTGHGPLVDLLATGASVYGYVATTNATKPIANAKAEIALYYDNSYWRGQSIHLSGIFFDEMSNDLANVAYYQALRDAVRQQDAAAYIIGNPGLSGTINPSNQTTYTAGDYGTVFNAIVVFEDYESLFADGYTAPTWQNDNGAAQLAMIVHTTPDVVGMQETMSRAFTRSATWLYITDAIEPNPYDVLPQFWVSETQLLPEMIFVDGFD
jgi:hypothetical protein